MCYIAIKLNYCCGRVGTFSLVIRIDSLIRQRRYGMNYHSLANRMFVTLLHIIYFKCDALTSSKYNGYLGTYVIISVAVHKPYIKDLKYCVGKKC